MNSRLDSLQASVLLEKLKILDAEIEARNKLSVVYDNHLSDCKGILTPTIMEYNFSSIAQYTIMTDHRDLIIKNLRNKIFRMQYIILFRFTGKNFSTVLFMGHSRLWKKQKFYVTK